MAGVAWLTAVLALILMREPSRSSQKHVGATQHASNLDRFRQTVQLTLNLSRNHQTIKLVLGLTFCLAVATMGPNMQWQPWYQQYSFFADTRRLGLIAVLVGISLGLGAILGYQVVNRFGARQALLICQMLVGTGLLLAIWNKGLAFGLPGFLLHELARGAFDPIQKTYLSSHAKESERATLLSLGSVPAHLGGVIGLLLSGILALKGSIALSWVGSGILLLAAAWWLARKLPA
jgi:predicted MFS family arabinose efflux permease